MTTLSFILVGLVMLFWGGSVIFDRLGLKRISEVEVLFWASLATFLGAVFLILLKGKLSISEPKGIGWAALAGFLGFLGLYLFFVLIKKYPVSLITPLVALYPLVTVILGILFFKEVLLWYHLLGILFALGGILLLTR